MSKHSLGAYRIIVLIRSGRTLMVEGVSDRTVVGRLLVDMDSSVAVARPVVDTPDIIEDALLTGLGNREKVLAIAEACEADPGKFRAVVDREWEGVDAENLTWTFSPNDVYADGKLSKTKGHSSENYFLEHQFVTSFLRRQYALALAPGVLRLIEDSFDSVRRLALAYSLAAREAGVVTRIGGLLQRRHIVNQDARFALNSSFSEDLQERGVAALTSNSFMSSVSSRLDALEAGAGSGDILKWGPHGHLGFEVVWCCVAFILQQSGCEEMISEQVERGFVSDKLKHCADYLASSTHDRFPLCQLTSWLAAA